MKKLDTLELFTLVEKQTAVSVEMHTGKDTHRYQDFIDESTFWKNPNLDSGKGPPEELDFGNTELTYRTPTVRFVRRKKLPSLTMTTQLVRPVGFCAIDVTSGLEF